MSEKIVITRNYSRREGTEMFSLTINREIDGNSTFLRQRAESYLALYDVEIQVLEEMVPLNYVTPVFFTKSAASAGSVYSSIASSLTLPI